MTNVPVARLPPALSPFVFAVGAVALLVTLIALWTMRRHSGVVGVFLMSYFAIMSIWPYQATRFWIPVIPLLVGLVACTLKPMLVRRRPRLLIVSYVVVFVTVGFAGQAFNTRRSWTGDGFPRLFADEYLGPAYRVAWGIADAADSASVDRAALGVILRYEPRVRDPEGAVGAPLR